MNKNDDYLWDRTGEPDPEIQELEQVLGTLRYKAPPLEIPAGVEPGRRATSAHRVSPLWAVAAAIAVIVLGLGVWRSMQRPSAPGVGHSDSKVTPIPTPDLTMANSPEVRPDKNASKGLDAATTAGSEQLHTKTQTETHTVSQKRPNLGGNSNRRRRVEGTLEPASPQLTASEMKEAQANKAKLMLALRVASTKLNYALKKTQSPNTGYQLLNQHRIG